MYQSFESLAPALRVFARRNKKFSFRSFYHALSGILSIREARLLFSAFGSRSDCIAAESKRIYRFICEPEFFSNEYVSFITKKLNIDTIKKKVNKARATVKMPIMPKMPETPKQEKVITIKEISLDKLIDEIKRRGYNLTLTK